MNRSKSRGFVLSFGDIMLPMIGIVAMALLFIAGRLFFFSESRPAAASLPIIKETPAKEVKRDEKTTQTNQANHASARPSASQSQPKPAAQAVVALPMPKPLSAPLPENFSDKSLTVPNSTSTDIVLAVPSKPAAQVKPITAPVAVATSAPAAATARRPAQKPTPAVQSSPAQTSPVWMVQVGAFSTAATANAYSKELSANGYSASVVSGARLYKVFVRGGATRAAATAIAVKIGQGAFVVAPDAMK